MLRTIIKQVTIDLPDLTLNDVTTFMNTASAGDLCSISHLAAHALHERLVKEQQRVPSAPVLKEVVEAAPVVAESLRVTLPVAVSAPAPTEAPAQSAPATEADDEEEEEADERIFLRLTSKGRSLYFPADVARTLGVKAGDRGELVPNVRFLELRLHGKDSELGLRLNSAGGGDALTLTPNVPQTTHLGAMCPRMVDTIYTIEVVRLDGDHSATAALGCFELTNARPVEAGGK